MNRAKVVAGLAGFTMLVGSAIATPILTISDGTSTTSIAAVGGNVLYPLTSLYGWNISATALTISGSPANPVLTMAIQATPLATASPSSGLIFTFSENGYTADPATFLATLTGQAFSGTGQPVTYNTYFDAGNVVGAQTSLLTTSGALGSGTYISSVTGGPTGDTLYSLTQVLSIPGAVGNVPPASYNFSVSLAGTASVPDGGVTVVLLGLSLAGLGLLRRTLG